MTTSHFDTLFRRLLISTMETNCTVLERSSLRSQPYNNCLYLKLSVAHDSKDVADVIENHALLSITFGLFEESCGFLLVVRSAHCRCLNLQELITLPQDSPPSAHCNPLRQRQNQPTKMQETHNQACARAVTYHCSQSRPSYATINTILLLLLLLEGNHNASRKHVTQASSLTLGALTLSLALSPHAATPAPRRKRILHLYSHPRLPSSSAASCFREDGLVHQQQGSKDQFRLGNTCRQDAYPELVACDPCLLSCSLGAPPSDLFSPFCAIRGPGDKEISQATNPRVARDFAMGDAHRSVVRLVRLYRDLLVDFWWSRWTMKLNFPHFVPNASATSSECTCKSHRVEARLAVMDTYIHQAEMRVFSTDPDPAVAEWVQSGTSHQ